MVITTEYVSVPSPAAPIRTFVAAPKAGEHYTGIWCYSDIFQDPAKFFCLQNPQIDSVHRLAYGRYFKA